MDTNILLAFLAGLIVILLIGRVLFLPLKWLFKLIINAIIGGAVLILINYFGALFNVHIPFNPLTALTVGLLGVPGIILLFVLQQIIIK